MELSYGLIPVYDSRKSFYGKAKVVIADGISTLYIYDTPVATIGPRFNTRPYPTLFGPWDETQTTLRHVKEFLRQHSFTADTEEQMRRDYEK